MNNVQDRRAGTPGAICRLNMTMRHAAAVGATLTAVSLGSAAVAQPAGPTQLRSVITVPNVPANGFYYDGSYVDAGRKLYYLGDRSTKGIDFVDIAQGKVVAQLTGILVGQAMKGGKLDNNVSGPNALEMVGPDELWIGDGDSTIKVVDLNSRTFAATIPMGGQARTDFIVYDPDHKVVLATNKNDAPPFISFVDPRSRKIVAKLEFKAKSLDGVVYDPSQKRYLVAVGPTAENPHGEVDAVDPVAHTVVARYPAPECFPAGLALGPSNHLLVGCSDDALAAGFKAKTLVMDATNGAVLATVNEVGGANYVAYNPGNRRFYIGARDMTVDGTKNTAKTPVLGIIDAVSMRFIESVPTAPNAKAVVADAATNRVFVPLTASPSGPGIGVFSD
jgi:DNA-binding beta-propeller fold protein YncE